MLRAQTRSKYVGVFLLLLVVVTAVPLLLFYFPSHPPDTIIIPLPEPDVQGSVSLSVAMRNPGYSENLTDYRMKVSEISQLLWAVQGITHGSVFRVIPSAGGTYPLEIVLVQFSDSELKGGYYHYIPQGHQLETVNVTVSRNSLISAFNDDDRRTVSSVSTVFFILANYSRTTDRYGDRGMQYVHLETGHAVQNFLLQLTSLGLKTRPITHFTSSLIQVLLDTSFVPLVALPVGLGDGSLQEVQDSTRSYNTDANEVTLEQAIAKRKSTRDYINGTVPVSVLSAILNDSSSVKYLECDSSQLDLRVVAGQVDGLATGSYHYWLANTSFSLISPLDLRYELMTAGLSQPWIETAQLDIVVSVDMDWVDTEPDPSFAHRLAMINIGMMAQNIYLKCAAYGLGTVTVGAFYEYDVATVVGLPSGFKPIYIMPIGLTPEFTG